jgi:hypothetical protein
MSSPTSVYSCIGNITPLTSRKWHLKIRRDRPREDLQAVTQEVMVVGYGGGVKVGHILALAYIRRLDQAWCRM